MVRGRGSNLQEKRQSQSNYFSFERWVVFDGSPNDSFAVVTILGD